MRLISRTVSDVVRSKNSSEAPPPFTLPPDGNNARVRPVARGTEKARRCGCSYPEGTAGRAARAARAQPEPECLCRALGQVGEGGVPVQGDPLWRALPAASPERR